MKKTHAGGCHCGAVRFEAVDEAHPVVGRFTAVEEVRCDHAPVLRRE
jgi:hypothetical protein